MPDNSSEQQNQNVIMRQLERLDERTRLMPTKDDINEIKRTMATKDYLDGIVKTQDYRLALVEGEVKILNGKLETEVKAIQQAQLSRSDKTWLRLTQLGSIVAILAVIADFLSRVRVLP